MIGMMFVLCLTRSAGSFASILHFDRISSAAYFALTAARASDLDVFGTEIGGHL
jgi:hypothetical protein